MVEGVWTTVHTAQGLVEGKNTIRWNIGPTSKPTISPVSMPSDSPMKKPSVSPVKKPTVSPVKKPTVSPVGSPTCQDDPEFVMFTNKKTTCSWIGGHRRRYMKYCRRKRRFQKPVCEMCSLACSKCDSKRCKKRCP